MSHFELCEQARCFGADRGAHWQGCAAGEGTVGLEADGKIKGCPSLPSDRWNGEHLGRDGLAATARTTLEPTYLKNRTKMTSGGSVAIATTLRCVKLTARGRVTSSLVVTVLTRTVFIARWNTTNVGSENARRSPAWLLVVLSIMVDAI